jgi:antitoxin component of RelBE/YafQ-DinJ toxin-antitoxin module
MAMERLDVRLDPEHRRKLKAIAAVRGISVSEAIRDMIDQTFEQARQAERLRAAQHLVARSIEDVPEPDVLKKHLAAAHDLPDLC